MTAPPSPLWASPGFALEPTSPRTGPFPEPAFLSTWWDTRAEPDDALLLTHAGAGMIPAMIRRERVELIGDAGVTDYHSPRGADLHEAAADLAAAVPAGTPFHLDSLPAEAAAPLQSALAATGASLSASVHEIAAVLELPSTFDDYLTRLGKKERHETRRKRRRFEAELGPPRLQRLTGADAVAMFATMHRKAAGDKSDFMDEPMERFFGALHHRVGAVVDVIVGDDDRPAAAAFGFEDETAYYLYNSAYDPAAAHASPGVVLTSMLIESAIASRRTVFDFLKGDETYKFRLGATPRPLTALSGRFRS